MGSSLLPLRADKFSLHLALLVAWVAMLGSLYFSEVAGYVPCTLCWYQRILMYPLAGLLAFGLLRKDHHLPYLVLPFSLIGEGFSVYHYLLQKTNLFTQSAACTSGVPCTTIWINWLGFITIPMLALIAFLLITLLALVAITYAPTTADEAEADSGRAWPAVVGIVAAILILFAGLTESHQRSAAAAQTAAPAAFPLLTGGDMVAVDGPRLYREACAACHGPVGEGVPNLGSILAGSDFIRSRSDAEILAFVRAGRSIDDAANTSGLVMPASGGRPDLTDSQLTAIVRYLRNE